MDARNELFVYLGSTLATIVGLFAVQLWYESYLDVAVIHAADREVVVDANVSAVRAEEQQKLSSGRIPIDQAMSAYAQRGRSASPKLAVKSSEDLSAMAGWIHRPNFAPYVPRKPPAPPPAEIVPAAEGVPAEGAPAEGAPAAEGAEQGAAPAAAPPAAAPTGAIPPAPAGVTAEAAKAAAERVRTVGERAPAPVRRAPATGAPAPSAAP